MQKRYFRYMEDMSSASLKSFLQHILNPGVYLGCNLSIDADGKVTLSAGKYIMSDGLIVEETSDVVVDTITEVAGTSWPIKTVVGYGANEGTLQRDSISYSIINGLESDASWATEKVPYVILGWLRRKADNSWEIKQPHKVNAVIPSPTEVKMVPPFPSDTVMPYVVLKDYGVRQQFRSTLNESSFSVHLGNIDPLSRVKCKLLGVPNNVHIRVALLGSDSVEESTEFEMYTSEDNSTIDVDFSVNRADCRYAALEFFFSLTERETATSVSATIESITFEVDPSKLM